MIVNPSNGTAKRRAKRGAGAVGVGLLLLVLTLASLASTAVAEKKEPELFKLEEEGKKPYKAKAVGKKGGPDPSTILNAEMALSAGDPSDAKKEEMVAEGEAAAAKGKGPKPSKVLEPKKVGEQGGEGENARGGDKCKVKKYIDEAKAAKPAHASPENVKKYVDEAKEATVGKSPEHVDEANEANAAKKSPADRTRRLDAYVVTLAAETTNKKDESGAKPGTESEREPALVSATDNEVASAPEAAPAPDSDGDVPSSSETTNENNLPATAQSPNKAVSSEETAPEPAAEAAPELAAEAAPEPAAEAAPEPPAEPAVEAAPEPPAEPAAEPAEEVEPENLPPTKKDAGATAAKDQDNETEAALGPSEESGSLNNGNPVTAELDPQETFTDENGKKYILIDCPSEEVDSSNTIQTAEGKNAEGATQDQEDGTPDTEAAQPEAASVSKLENGGENVAGNKTGLTTAVIALIVVSAVGIVAVALFALNRRRRRYAEMDVGEDGYDDYDEEGGYDPSGMEGGKFSSEQHTDIENTVTSQSPHAVEDANARAQSAQRSTRSILSDGDYTLQDSAQIDFTESSSVLDGDGGYEMSADPSRLQFVSTSEQRFRDSVVF